MVRDLVPGDQAWVGGQTATFLARRRHPSKRWLQQVVWRLTDGSLATDALPVCAVVAVVPATDAQRAARLRVAVS